MEVSVVPLLGWPIRLAHNTYGDAGEPPKRVFLAAGTHGGTTQRACVPDTRPWRPRRQHGPPATAVPTSGLTGPLVGCVVGRTRRAGSA